MRSLPAFAALPFLLLAAACDEPRAAPVASHAEPVINGQDDRQDVYEHPTDVLKTTAISSIAAVVRSGRFFLDGTTFVPVGSTLEERNDLCSDQRYGNQLSIATCSATLIDDDLVLTAGHCVVPRVKDEAGSLHCNDARFVFDFYMTSPTALQTIGLDDVYSCRRVVAWSFTGDLDYAIVQLDRPVVGRTPAPVTRSRGRLEVGTPVAEIGFPTGIPMKIDDGGYVTDPGPKNLDFFVTSLDAFHGNSGSGVFDADGNVVGILVRSMASDYAWDSRGQCTVVDREVDESLATEMVTYAFKALDDLCGEQGYPSARLCGGTPSCGDGFCTSGETLSCPGDCPQPIEGDGNCSGGETPENSPYDCGPFVPPSGAICSVGAPGAALPVGLPGLALVACALALARRAARRRAPLVVALVALFVSLGLPTSASAEPRIASRGTRYVLALDGGFGGGHLYDPSNQFPSSNPGIAELGLRLGAEALLGRWLALEGALTQRVIAGLPTYEADLTVAPRIRLLVAKKRELYLRPAVGMAILPYADPKVGAVIEVGVGYRRQFTRVWDVFVEFGGAFTFGRQMDVYWASAYGGGYGLHPSAPPSLAMTRMVFVVGVGFGRGVVPPCPTAAPPISRAEPSGAVPAAPP